jgi:hypothetical protein
VLANPQSCGPAVASADLRPWSAPGTPDALLKPEYIVDSDGAWGRLPRGVAALNPSFNAGTTGPAVVAAGAFTQFLLMFGREDREQDRSGVEVHLPRGLVGKIAAVKQCGAAEVHAAQRIEGECPAESQIGTATAGAGPGPHPFFQKGKDKPDRFVQGCTVRARGRHARNRRSVHPRQHRGPLRDRSRPPAARPSRPPPTRCRS